MFIFIQDWVKIKILSQNKLKVDDIFDELWPEIIEEV